MSSLSLFLSLLKLKLKLRSSRNNWLCQRKCLRILVGNMWCSGIANKAVVRGIAGSKLVDESFGIPHNNLCRVFQQYENRVSMCVPVCASLSLSLSWNHPVTLGYVNGNVTAFWREIRGVVVSHQNCRAANRGFETSLMNLLEFLIITFAECFNSMKIVCAEITMSSLSLFLSLEIEIIP